MPHIDDLTLHFLEVLTHCEMVISQKTYSNVFYSMKMFDFRFRISLKFAPKGPVNNTPALAQIMAWGRPGARYYMNKWRLVSRRIYVSLGLNEF